MKSRRRRLICRWLGVVILVAWGMSYVRSFGFILNPPGDPSGADRLMADYGRLYIQQNIGGSARTGFHVSVANPPGFLDKLPYMGRLETPLRGEPWRVTVPPALTVIVGSCLIGCSFHMPRYKRRPKWFPAGCCQKCGYDITGIDDRCPECGHTIGEPVNR